MNKRLLKSLKLRYIFLLFPLLATQLRADEGMWLLNNLDRKTTKQMKRLGLELSDNQLYNSKSKSLKDAVVSFGGFCSGVVVSEHGLVFTNHHCGYGHIQRLSSVDRDLLTNGFTAQSYTEELPCNDLFVKFLVRTDNITKEVHRAFRQMAKTKNKQKKTDTNYLDLLSPSECKQVVDSIALKYNELVKQKDSTLTAEMTSFFKGEEYYLSVYRNYYDIRLVFAPPSSVGKFGGDTDNWMWPRHTGDFGVFRIYADAQGMPADYSPENRPLHTPNHAKLSLEGYQEGDFCMTLGYPGNTQRTLSSFGVDERVGTRNEAMIQVRGVKQDIWKKWMDRHEDIRIKYASKYAQSSNYWKNSIGMNQSVSELNIIAEKQKLEQMVLDWANKNPKTRKEYLTILDELKEAYAQRRETMKASSYLVESFMNTGSMLDIARRIFSIDRSPQNPDYKYQIAQLKDQYNNLDSRTDKETLISLFENYKKEIHSDFWPPVLHQIDTLYQGNTAAYIDTLYATSALKDSLWLIEKRFMSDEELYKDPVMEMTMDLFTTYFVMEINMSTHKEVIERGERLLSNALRQMQEDTPAYSDANSTLRLSFGTVQGYTSRDGVRQPIYTTPEGLLKKVESTPPNPDYKLTQSVAQQLRTKEYGRYVDTKSNNLQLCFVTNNDITGGNSGSPMFNARGELLGLAFDGNWDAMSSDLLFNKDLTRCIGVDVRYMLYLMDIWGGAKNLINEVGF